MKGNSNGHNGSDKKEESLYTKGDLEFLRENLGLLLALYKNKEPENNLKIGLRLLSLADLESEITNKSHVGYECLIVFGTCLKLSSGVKEGYEKFIGLLKREIDFKKK